MIINISDSFIRSAMQSLDPGKGGYVALITDTDGKSFIPMNPSRRKKH